jgi:tetratricopeptide (TPR) repeat protein
MRIDWRFFASIYCVSALLASAGARPAAAEIAKPEQDCLDAAQRLDSAAAQTLCNQALQDSGLGNLDRAYAFMGCGLAAELRHDPTSAIADYSQAIQLQPDLGHAYLWRGLALQAQGEDAKAAEDFAADIRLNPDEPTGYRDRAQLAVKHHDWAAALPDLDKLLDLSPQEADMLFLRGYVHQQRGETAAAKTDYAAARAIDAKIDDEMRLGGIVAAP